MSGNQPESQMLELWSSHRRRTVYAVRPVGEPTDANNGNRVKRYLRALPIIAGLLALLSGCAVYPDRGGYYGRGQGYGYGNQGYYRGYNGYGNPGYGGYGNGGGWRHHHHHQDDDDDD